jgi:hypothetical protein
MRVFHPKTIVASAAGVAVATVATLLLAPASAGASARQDAAFLSNFKHISTIGSTVPKNGDVNPYGIVVISATAGRLQAGDVLISNFNNKKNLQGTGSTIVEITPGGHLTQFARITKAMLAGRCPGGAGLSTALTVLPGGWVVVGSTPSRNGQASTSRAGCLIVLGNRGRVRETFTGNGINGPWDATSVSRGAFSDVFVANVLNGTVAANGSVVNMGTVLRLRLRVSGNTPPSLTSTTVIGSGFAEQTSSTAFVLGPTGVGLGRHGTLFVADTQNSQITAIPGALERMSSAGTGTMITSGGMLNAPLGLAVAPNGDILTVNGNDGRIVETVPFGKHAGMQIAALLLDKSGSPPGAGALFGLTIAPGGSGVYYVDDAANTLRLLH